MPCHCEYCIEKREAKKKKMCKNILGIIGIYCEIFTANIEQIFIYFHHFLLLLLIYKKQKKKKNNGNQIFNT